MDKMVKAYIHYVLRSFHYIIKKFICKINPFAVAVVVPKSLESSFVIIRLWEKQKE